MRIIITLLILFASLASFGQSKKGRAIVPQKISVGRIDTLYFTNDTLYLTEDGLVFKTYIDAANNYPTSLGFSTSTGVLSLGRSGLSPLTVGLDNRYGNLTGINNWSAKNTFETNTYFETQIYLDHSTGLSGAITASSGTLMSIDGSPSLRLASGSNRQLNIYDTGIFADLDAATSANVVYYDLTTGEITYGVASAGGGLWESDTYGIKYNVTGKNVGVGIAPIALSKFYAVSAAPLTAAIHGKHSGTGSGIYGQNPTSFSNTAAAVTGNGASIDFQASGSGIFSVPDLLALPSLYAPVTNRVYFYFYGGNLWKRTSAGVNTQLTGLSSSTTWTDEGTELYPTNGENVRVDDILYVGDGGAVADWYVQNGVIQFPSYFNSSASISNYGKMWSKESDDRPMWTNPTATYTFDLTSASDFWKKKNFKLIDSPLDKILSIQSYHFDWKKVYPLKVPTDSINVVLVENDGNYESTGFIAQEVREIVPEIVSEVDENGYLQVDYDGLVPYLVEAIKEQQKQIEDLQRQINEKAK